MLEFLIITAMILAGLAAAGVVSRAAFAISEKIARAPLLDVFVSLFTWIPWVAGAWLGGWRGVLAAVVAQVIGLHAFCLLDRAIRGGPKRTLTAAQGRLLGPLRNQLALLATAPASVAFVVVRLMEIAVYPVVARLARLPRYRHCEWVNLSRHKYQGLTGYDLLWCWYCDWMTGVWALGGEMLRNVESFWCPIRFRDEAKIRNVAVDFPDVELWADGTIDDAVRAFEDHYDGTRPNSWWGHPDRTEK